MALVESKAQKNLDENKLEEEAQWIKKYLKRLGVNSKLNEIQSILHFALLWNLFDGKVCETHANIHKFENVVKELNVKGKLQLSNFISVLDYFKSRYVFNGKTNNKFDRLSFRHNDRKDFVSNVLERSFNDLESREDEVVLALMIIVYRLRNNFFHGIKPLERVHTQAENFQMANKFLMHIIDLAI